MVLTLSPGTCCNGAPNNSIDLANPVVSYASKEYAMLTDLTIGNTDLVGACGKPIAAIWSNNSATDFNSGDYITGSVYNGVQEYFIKNTSGCSAQIIADKEFNPPGGDGDRTIIGSLATVVANANARLATMPAPYNTMFLTAVGTVIKLNGAPYCFRLTGLARIGNVDTCGTGVADTTLSGRLLTNFVPTNS